MRRFIKAAVRGVRAEIAAGDSGWMSMTQQQALNVLGAVSKSGQNVNQQSVLQLSAVWACVARTSGLIGSLPGALYERQADGGRKKVVNDLSRILAAQPNPGQTGFEFWEGNTAQILLQGNGYNEKLMIGGRLVGLRPLFNAKRRIKRDGKVVFEVRENGRLRTLAADQVFHIPGFGAGDGDGLSAVRYGVQSLGSALSADEAAGTVFANGLTVGGVIQSDQTLSSEQRADLQTLLSTFIGSKKAGKTLTLEAGLKYQQISMNPEDAQLLETRRFQVDDICRWFGTPPIVIGHASEGTTMWGSGVESIMLAWRTMGINPLLRRIEARINRDLIPANKRDVWYWEWNRDAMMQMDSKAKSEFLSKMVSVGIISRDEARVKLNEERRGGAADELMAQTAMAGLEQLITKASET
ncbi:phage portal protein, HK97 family [Yoonia tamlensis]|uniref:Phage portal protein, HK97 family n=1 Tax=Yoonia tamlensis TaxID=390270 RepID=A0A1I6GEK7_9RHOB|nr:phage portal protein [Yoonia tamlensis]SFR40541.1 phage portal protein, HK97 family [Yoonia tamlensis]